MDRGSEESRSGPRRSGSRVVALWLTAVSALASAEARAQTPPPAPQETPQPYGQPYPQPYGQPYPQPYGQPYPQPYGQPYPQPYPQPYGQPYPQPYGQPYPQPYGQPYPQPYGQPYPQPYSYPPPAPPAAAPVAPGPQPPSVVHNWDPNAPAPAGWEVVEGVNGKLIGIGAGLLAAGWLTSTLVGGLAAASENAEENDGEDSVTEDDWTPLYIPVVGPFAALVTLQPEPAAMGLLIADGVIQVGGAFGIVIGIVDKRTKLVRTTAGAWRVAPIMGQGFRGLTVGGPF